MKIAIVRDGDGIDVHVDRYDPIGDPRAVVHVMHGWAEHAGRYARLASVLTEAGLVMYADDHRGHGRTGEGAGAGQLGDLGPGGQDGAVLSAHDVTEYVASQHPGLPLFVIGHSWGSFLAQRIIRHWGDALSGVVLIGTTDRRGPRRAGAGGLNEGFSPARTQYDWLSRDEVEVDLYVRDPRCGFERLATPPEPAPSKRTLLDADQGAVPRALPILILNGSADPVGGREGGEALESRYTDEGVKDVTLLIYEGARHELLNETNRDEVTADLIDWLHARSA